MAELRRITLAIEHREGDRFHLTPEVRHYLQRVLRLGVGDRCIVADGGGQAWEVELVNVSTSNGSTGKEQGELEARILNEIHPNPSGQPTQSVELSVPLVLVAAVPKGNGFDEVVRQVTELGVTSIVPVTSDRTVLDPSPKRVARWRRIATEAFEQCERAIVPSVLPPQRLDQWLKTPRLNLTSPANPVNPSNPVNPVNLDIDSETNPVLPHTASQSANSGKLLKVIAVARADAPPLRQVIIEWRKAPQHAELRDSTHSDGLTKPSGVVMAIGPEGGWTPRERALALDAGYIEVSLGRRILRAVTASVAAVTIGAEAIEAITAIHPSDADPGSSQI